MNGKKKLIALMIGLLLSCSIGYCQSENRQILLRGVCDSITISIEDIRKVNTKLIDARFDKAQLELYKQIKKNDDQIIDSLMVLISDERENNWSLECEYDKQVNKKKFWCGTSCALGVVVILLILL